MADKLTKALLEHARKQWQVDHMAAWIAIERAKGRPESELTWGNCIRETGVLVDGMIHPQRGMLVPVPLSLAGRPPRNRSVRKLRRLLRFI